MYIPILYVTKMTQNKNDSIIRVVDSNYCVLFPTSRFPYLICVPDIGNGR